MNFAQLNTWQHLYPNTTRNLLSVQFLDSLVGYAGGYLNQTLKTSDAGASWQIYGDYALHHIFDFAVIGEDTLASAHSTYPPYTTLPYGYIGYSVNTGSSWNSHYLGGDGMWAIDFVGPDTGYVGGYWGKIAKTFDGGITWNQITGNLPPNHLIWGMDFPSNCTGYVVGHYRNGFPQMIGRTQDCGLTWDSLTTPTFSILKGASFVNDTTGIVVGQNGTIIGTSDGGMTWNVQNSGVTVELHDVQMINDSIVYCVGDSGVILMSDNGGNSWGTESSGTVENLLSLHFLTPTLGYVVGDKGTILTTNQDVSPKGFEVDTLIENLTDFGNSSILHPNPTNGLFKVTTLYQNNHVVIYDLSGREIFNKKSINTNQISINLTGVEDGMYIVRVKTNNLYQTHRLVIQDHNYRTRK